ncbi:MAG TPA: ATP-binding cassette domain-containing protein [Dehalococcoidales bacterium]|nr:ATP-binding cassette domain-containing protein [Dehalococcoidales bacterium]
MSESKERKFECSGAAIAAKAVMKKFGSVRALDGIDLEVNSGTIFALLGPNGSGKTTLVRILTTLLRPDSGTARVGDYDVVKEAHLIRPVIGLAGQYPAVDDNLTGKENLEMIGSLYHLGSRKSKQRAGELLDSFGLVEAANRMVKTYSGGMRRRLDLAAALVAAPPVLFLDEPTTGLDPRSRLGLWEVITSQARQCNTVFLTTQYLEEADRLANHIAIMEKGKIIRQGTPQELKDCCGGETHVKMKLADRSLILKATEALNGLGKEKPYSNQETGEISIPSPGGAALLAEVVRRLDSAGIEIVELGLKQPTLDDVFLSLTGHTAENDSGADTSRDTEEKKIVK